MNNRTTTLIATLLVLGTVYVFFFTDWFKKKQIQISFRTFPGRSAKAEVEPIFFLLDKQYKLTSVKVVPAEEAKSKSPHLLWQLIADTNSVPVTDFRYGDRVKGMKPGVPKAMAEKLSPDARYRIIVDAGRLHGEREFTAKSSVGRPE